MSEIIKINYELSTGVILDESPLRRPNKRAWPRKLVKIIQAVFNKPLMLDHVRYVKENGRHVFYTAPYNPVDAKKINFEMANKYGVEWIELENISYDDVTTPYKILIRNPGSLRKRYPYIGFHGL
jgi:hypothetical protein